MFNIFEARLCCNTLSSENQIGTTRFSGSFVRINQLLCTYLTTPTQSTSFGVLFASLLSGWTTTTVMDCLARMGNMRRESFPRTQRRIASSKIKPESATFTRRSTTIYRYRFFRSKHMICFVMTVFF